LWIHNKCFFKLMQGLLWWDIYRKCSYNDYYQVVVLWKASAKLFWLLLCGISYFFCNYYNMQVVFLNAKTFLIQSMNMNYTYVNIKGTIGCTKKTICWFFACPFNGQRPLNICLNIPLNIWLSKCHSLLPNVVKFPCIMICFQTLIN
jgi:hypothetical protein